jgi:hypothetical protein
MEPTQEIAIAISCVLSAGASIWQKWKSLEIAKCLAISESGGQGMKHRFWLEDIIEWFV